MKNTKLESFFLTSGEKKIFVSCCRSDKQTDISQAVIILPPFAEEMNKSRRMLSLQARQLAEAGFHVLMPDFYGTGDSEGHFRDALLNDWLNNVLDCLAWIKSRGVKQVHLIVLRFACLLVPAVQQKAAFAFDKVVMWQPMVSGELLIAQFLRLRIASGLFGSGEKKETSKGLRELLAKEKLIEVAGYELSSGLVSQLDSLLLRDLSARDLSELLWLDVVASEDKTQPLVTRKIIEQWQAVNPNIIVDKVVGVPFWASVEIEENAALLKKTTEFLIK